MTRMFRAPTGPQDPSFVTMGRYLARGQQVDPRGYGAEDYAQELRLVWWQTRERPPEYQGAALRRATAYLRRQVWSRRRLAAAVEEQAQWLPQGGWDESARLESRACLRHLEMALSQADLELLVEAPETSWPELAAAKRVSVSTLKRRHRAALAQAAEAAGG